jgi:predicted helicase
MSLQLISKYYAEINKFMQYGGTHKETSIRTVFQNLLNEYAQTQNLLLIPELEYRTSKGKIVRPDGTLKDALRLDWGYWESKDTSSDLETEIEKKFKQGYPNSNILFEDGQTAILYQKGDMVGRCDMRNPKELDLLLTRFVTYTRSEVRDFRDAIEKFKEDLPQVLDALRQMIEQQVKENKNFVAVRESFLELCKNVINENVELADVNEMLIQHILTEEIFTTVFDDPQFHQENNISKELQKLERTFFTGKTKHDTLDTIKIYYQMIKARAGEIANHTEKQKFLKIVYEHFYKGYNPKAADRLGIIYTPDEIVRFMIESTDYLLHKHFNKILASKNVEILDPATGTGTFICDIIDHLPEKGLTYKYQNEIHCNEVAILPYYIANLNIEATFKQKMKFYEEFQNICFVDTLDNTEPIQHKSKEQHLFAISAENAERVKRQNKKKISVIIGNPPYNAKQENYNYQNANRFYKIIDQRIRDTYVKEGKAQNQITLFDMYVRFIRWASDRIDQNGIIALITNRSYVDSIAFDGFRKCVEREFSDIYIIDTHSDVRENPKISGTKYNVFGIQTGVAVIFLVKKADQQGLAQIFYSSLTDEQTRKEKLDYFASTGFRNITFELIRPDKKKNWLNLTDNDFDTLLPLMDKSVKSGLSQQAIFKIFSRGLASQRDEWVYDFSENYLEEKIKFFVDIYSKTHADHDFEDKRLIKWDRELDKYLSRNIKKKFIKSSIVKSLYRPFDIRYFYFDEHFNGMTYQWFDIFSTTKQNLFIAMNSLGNSKPFHTIASEHIVDLHCTGDSQVLPLYYFDESGNLIENITNWGLKLFQEHYKNKKITKDDIFHYVYAVFHNPAYRKKYEINLKREFPRIPFYDDFKNWCNWGKTLMDLHINFETAAPFNLKRVEKVPPKQKRPKLLDVVPTKQLPESEQAERSPKPRLKTDKEHGSIELDDQTTLTGVPKEAWEYKLGNRSALEWVLDQYKEYKPSDLTIAEKFNTYRFADYKEKVIDLLKRVCTVSVKTMEIIEKML